MTSNIDTSKPITGSPTTQSVRENFAAAKEEIEDLQTAVASMPTMWDDAITAACAVVAATCAPPYIATGPVNINVAAGGTDAQTGQEAPTHFATLAGALRYAQTIDNAGYPVTIAIPAGAQAGGISITGLRRKALLTIQGPEAYPYSTLGRAVIAPTATAAHTILADGGLALVLLRNLALESGGYAGQLASAARAGQLTLDNVELGACSNAQVFAYHAARVVLSNSTWTTGNAPYFAAIDTFSILSAGGGTLVAPAARAYTGAVLYASSKSIVTWRARPYTGTITGTRYSAAYDSIIDNAGQPQTTMPGNVAGAIATGSAFY